MAARETLGIRQRNPGNIRPPSGEQWQGTIGVGSGFVIFDRMDNGIRALGKQLLAYVEGRPRVRIAGQMMAVPSCIGYWEEQREDPSTGAKDPGWVGIIPTWAPTNENDTEAYIKYVCGVCEVDGRDKLNLRDPDTLYWLIVGIGEHENGRQSFHLGVSEADIEAGLNKALA